MDLQHLLNAHIVRFNDAVNSGDFTEMVSHFSDGASMIFEGVPVGPFSGREAIAGAYAAQPPDDQLVLLEIIDEGPDSIEMTYAWGKEPDRRAGTMSLAQEDGQISRLVIRFEESA